MSAIMKTHRPEIKAPAGLILINPNSTYPPGWSNYSAANDRAIKPTHNDSDVGNSGAVSSISYNMATSGGHTSGTDYRMRHYGYYETSTSPYPSTPSKDYASQGSHTHNINFGYTQPRMQSRLAIAGPDAIIPPGLICMAEETLQHTAYSYFDNWGGYLGGGTSTSKIAQAIGTGYIGSGSIQHNHDRAVSRQASGFYTAHYGFMGEATPIWSHTHGGAMSPGVTADLYNLTLRLYTLKNGIDLNGILGFWPYSGIPDGWELANSAWTNRYLRFQPDGTAVGAGNGRIVISGTTSSEYHNHGVSGYSTVNDYYSPIPHSNWIYHSHSIARNHTWGPNYHYLKIIKYTG